MGSGSWMEVVGERPRLTAERLGRSLFAARGEAALGTLEEPSHLGPHVSHVLYHAVEGDALLMLSDLARHTRNLTAREGAGLLVRGPAVDGAALPRLSLRGAAAPLPRGDSYARLLAAFLEHHPEAAAFSTFRDVRLWSLAVQAIHFIEGFGRIHRIRSEAWHQAQPEPIATAWYRGDLSPLLGRSPYLSRLADLFEVEPHDVQVHGLDALGIDAVAAGQRRSVAFSLPLASVEDLLQLLLS